jgi:flagellin
MSLRINNNIAAINAHRNLVNTTTSLSKSMEKLSSGYRINRAADNPAGLVISEQFRAQIAGLNKAIDNSEGSINMIQTAEGALTEINSLLVSMRELAIHAANEGFNDSQQLAADQAEIDNAIKTIDRIAANTQFGTKKLLDGTKANTATITSSNTSLVTIKESSLTTGSHSITATKTADSTAALNTTSLGLSVTSTVTPYNLSEGIHNIDVLQASAGATKTSAAIDLVDAFGNGITFAAAATAAQIASDAALAAAATAGNAGTYTVTLNYQENGEAVTGVQTLSIDVADTDTRAATLAAWNSAIANNTALTGKIEAVLTAGNELQFQSVNAGGQYSLALTGSTATLTTGTPGTDEAFTFTNADARGSAANALAFTVKDAKNPTGHSATIAITAGAYTSMSTLITEINTRLGLLAELGTAAAGVNNLTASLVGTNQIKFATADEGSDYSVQLLTTGATGGEAQDILALTPDSIATSGTDALVSFDNYTTAITSVNYASTRDVVIGNKADGVTGRGEIGLTIATGSTGVNIGNLLLDVTAARFDVRLDAGPATSVTAGVDTMIFNANRTETTKINLGLTSNGGTESINNTDQSLVFQIGANVGQTAKIGLSSMAASSLSRGIAGNMFRSLAEANVTTVQGAQDAQTLIDAAINEVSTSRGTLGSFQKNTLESNLRNLRIASQNLSSAESNIRDTDMAKEMSEFVKYQILLQAGVSMLAQGNQVPQVVLSLFQ